MYYSSTKRIKMNKDNNKDINIPSTVKYIEDELVGKIPPAQVAQLLIAYLDHILENYNYRFKQIIGWKFDPRCVQIELDNCKYLNSEIIAIAELERKLNE